MLNLTLQNISLNNEELWRNRRCENCGIGSSIDGCAGGTERMGVTSVNTLLMLTIGGDVHLVFAERNRFPVL